MNQKTFFERLLLDCNQVAGLEIGFPQEYQFDRFAMLKKDLESLADKYGLKLPAKLKRGKLILEIKTQDEKPEESTFNPRKNSDHAYSLSSEELKAIECAF